jgi:hypothetical protein
MSVAERLSHIACPKWEAALSAIERLLIPAAGVGILKSGLEPPDQKRKGETIIGVCQLARGHRSSIRHVNAYLLS